MNAFVTCMAENSIQRIYRRRPACGDFNNSAIASRFLRKQQRVGEGIVGRTINRIEIRKTRHGIRRSQQGDSVCRISYVQIHPRDICQVAAVFVSLKNEMTSVIKAFAWAAWIVVENQVG